MKVIGLTGGVGMGKSVAESFLRERGVLVVDTDALARQLAEPGQPALDEIRQAFGAEVLAQDGHLRRDELARRVFKDEGARRKLEGILHPRIRMLWQQQIELWANENRPVAVVVIPLLFETGAESEFDETICIACTGGTQQERLLGRGWSEAEIEQRIRAQLPIEKKMEKADYVIWNEGPLDVLAGQLGVILP